MVWLPADNPERFTVAVEELLVAAVREYCVKSEVEST
jgi:hypothetical protein